MGEPNAAGGAAGAAAITGVVTDIQRFSIHDGPGIRTTVFLKGCPLRCFWCHNPEALAPRPELQYYADRCIACGACVVACPEDAHTMRDGQHSFDRARCTACGRCVETCYTRALVMAGETRSAHDVAQVVLRDAAFYETSGGGVTVSGGEPLQQPEFTRALLGECRAAGVHTAIETSGHAAWDRLREVLSVTDLVMMDVKTMDPEIHRQATGVTNERILANARRISEHGTPLILRTPIVPGVNDSDEAIAAVARFASDLKSIVKYELLRFHMMAGAKYAAIGLECRAADLTPPDDNLMERLTARAASFGVTVEHT